MKPFLLAAPSSNTGKTVTTAALLSLLVKKGMRVGSYKVGPDYIDPKFHSFITGRPCHNLDSFMIDKKLLTDLFEETSRACDIGLIEGVMGLFDGLGTTATASSAGIAELLDIPVILVIDPSGQSRSAAALVKGFMDFNRRTTILGVICNMISSERHYNLVKESIENYCQIPVLGYLKKNSVYELSSRHLGLVPLEELGDYRRRLDLLTAEAEKTLELEKLIDALPEAKTASTQRKEDSIFSKAIDQHHGQNLRMALAQDSAFHFYYEANLSMLREAGIKLVPFSILEDDALPENIDALYIGGGYPEVFAEKISNNVSMMGSIKDALEGGLPCYAECGGLMVLTHELVTLDGRSYPMAGFFNAKTEMTRRLQRFGYVTIEYNGHTLKGHEFHHSRLIENKEKNYTLEYEVTKASDNKKWPCGLCRKNTLAAYGHIHFLGNTVFLDELIHKIEKAKKKK